MEVQCRQFLHNFEHKEQLFQGKYEAYRSLQNETYGKGEEERLAEDLKALFSARPRPDVAERFLAGTYVLGQIGMREFALDLDMGKRIYVEKDEFYNPTPIFMISAKKGC